MGSRGQGHGVCARRPRITSHPNFPTLKGSNPSPRRDAIAKEDTGGEHKAESSKCKAESGTASF